jgi:hypothetical protein
VESDLNPLILSNLIFSRIWPDSAESAIQNSLNPQNQD